MIYKVHYSVVLGYDMEIEADDEDEALDIASVKIDDIGYDDMEFGDNNLEVIRVE